jgi:DNA ligase-1
MDVADLAGVFAQIEATTRRQTIADLLADLFGRYREDAAILPYLLQGRLGPPYATPDLGLDEHRLAEALAAAAGVSRDEVMRRLTVRGDLGLVADEILPAQGQPLTLHDLVRQFRCIADTRGPGAHGRKVALFSDLLRRLERRSARYVIRLAQGRLRLGVGDAAVIDALARAAAGDAALRDRIARAYSLCADLGLVAGALLREGPTALDRIHPAPGRPVLFALAERLPSPQEVVRRLGRVLAEPKFDGLRLQAQRDGDRVWLFSRRLEDLTHAFPDLVRAVRGQVRAQQVILDGEAVGYAAQDGRFLPFQETVRRRRTHDVERMEARYPLRYYVFDLLFVDGEDLSALPFTERRRRLEQVVREQADGTILLTPQVETADAQVLTRYFDEVTGAGLEGLVVKRPDAPYHAGARNFDWVKLKRAYQAGLADTFDLVVVGYNRGRGKRARLGIGSLLCACYDPESGRFRTVSRAGSGLTDEEWARLRAMLDAISVAERPPDVEAATTADVWVEPRYVVEVIASEITRSPLHTCGKVDGGLGYALRFPRIARLRPDRRPEEATTEAEIQAMYRWGPGTQPAPLSGGAAV